MSEFVTTSKSRTVTAHGIFNNNLTVSTYVEAEDTREIIDIKVLNEEIKEIVVREEKLRAEIDTIIAEIEV